MKNIQSEIPSVSVRIVLLYHWKRETRKKDTGSAFDISNVFRRQTLVRDIYGARISAHPPSIDSIEIHTRTNTRRSFPPLLHAHPFSFRRFEQIQIWLPRTVQARATTPTISDFRCIRIISLQSLSFLSCRFFFFCHSANSAAATAVPFSSTRAFFYFSDLFCFLSFLFSLRFHCVTTFAYSFSKKKKFKTS